MTPPRPALVFANGSVNDGILVQRVLQQMSDPLIVAADGGARIAFDHFDLIPHVIIGDLDSLDPDHIEQFRSKGSTVIPYSPEKDETDLELALKWAADQGAIQIRVIGALGRRIDQTFGNVYLLALPELAQCDVRLVATDQEVRLLSAGRHIITGDTGDTISLIPLSSDVHNIHTEGLYYPLYGETLHFGRARGISNVLQSSPATVTFDDGRLLIVHTLGRAE